LPDGQLQDSDRQDPTFFRTNGAIKGRDGARVPLPWSGDTTPFGFSTGKPWLPISQSWKDFTIENELGDPKSSLHLYRNALQLRKEFLVGAGGITWIESSQHGQKGDSLLSYIRGAITVVMNLSDSAKECHAAGKLIIVSGGTVDARDGKKLIPAYSTAWFLT